MGMLEGDMENTFHDLSKDLIMYHEEAEFLSPFYRDEEKKSGLISCPRSHSLLKLGAESWVYLAPKPELCLLSFFSPLSPRLLTTLTEIFQY